MPQHITTNASIVGDKWVGPKPPACLPHTIRLRPQQQRPQPGIPIFRFQDGRSVKVEHIQADPRDQKAYENNVPPAVRDTSSTGGCQNHADVARNNRTNSPLRCVRVNGTVLLEQARAEDDAGSIVWLQIPTCISF